MHARIVPAHGRSSRLEGRSTRPRPRARAGRTRTVRLAVVLALVATVFSVAVASAINTVSDSVRLALGVSGNPAGAYGGGTHLSAWAGAAEGGSDVFARGWTGAGVVDAAFPVSSASGVQEQPAMEWDGTTFLVVWQDRRGSTADIYGQRVAPDGTLVGPEIAVTTASADQISPRVAWNGATSEFMVAWTDYRNCYDDACGVYPDLFAQRIADDGTLVGSNFALVAESPTWKAISALEWEPVGGGYLAATSTLDGGYRQAVIHPLASDGSASGSPLSLAPGAWHKDHATLAWTGAGFLAAWTDWRNGVEDADIYQARIGVGPIALGAVFALINEAGSQTSPSLGWNGAVMAVGWEDFRYGGSVPDVFVKGHEVSQNGLVPLNTELALATGPSGQFRPTTTYGGFHQFEVMYRDGAELLLKRTNIGAAQVFADGDRDGFGDASNTNPPRAGYLTYVADNTDCDDANSSVHPGADEIAGNGVDDDCDPSTTGNSAPQAVAGTANVNEDGVVAVTLSATDVDSDPLSFSITTLPTSGALHDGNTVASTLITPGALPYELASGVVTYRPNANFNGSDSFGFTASDGIVDSTEVLISVTVDAVLDPTLLAYTGPVLLQVGSSFTPTAALTSGDSSCLAGQLVSFSLDRSPLGGRKIDQPYLLGSGITDGSGIAEAPALNTSGWRRDTYTVTASFAGTAACGGSQEATLLSVRVPKSK